MELQSIRLRLSYGVGQSALITCTPESRSGRGAEMQPGNQAARAEELLRDYRRELRLLEVRESGSADGDVKR